MLLAANSPLDHVQDHALWQVTLLGMKVTVLSSGIIAMLIVAALLIGLVVPIARRRKHVPSGASGVLELLVLFVRDMIARPALHDKAYRFLPFLLTMFFFTLGMNVLGMLPFDAILTLFNATQWVHIPRIASTPTATLTVTGGLALITMAAILVNGWRTQARLYVQHHHWNPVLAAALSPLLWVKTLSPPLPGALGVVMFLPLMLMELVGFFTKMFSLMVRLFANMVAGHVLLAVLLSFVAQAISTVHIYYIGPLSVLMSTLVSLLEVLVAVLQAYILTFLSAMFLAMYVEPAH